MTPIFAYGHFSCSSRLFFATRDRVGYSACVVLCLVLCNVWTVYNPGPDRRYVDGPDSDLGIRIGILVVRAASDYRAPTDRPYK